MRKTIVGMAICMATFALSAAAQNTYPAIGNVGVGTANPGFALQVFENNTSQSSALYVENAAPAGGVGLTGVGYTERGITAIVDGSNGTSSYAAFYSSVQGTGSVRVGYYIDGVGGSNNYGIYAPVGGMEHYFAGNVGIGTTTPGADLASLPAPPAPGTPVLEVSGDIALAQTKGGSIIFQDGTVQSTAYTGVTCGGDYAESVDVAGVRGSYEPGDVLIIDPDSGSDVVKSNDSYSTLVAGVYSTKPGVVGRRQATASKVSNTEVPMAIIGIVPTKVSAENGPVRRGDLLVTSSIPGYAMKGVDHSRMLGAVIGKALGNLDSGTGVVEVLITLQ